MPWVRDAVTGKVAWTAKGSNSLLGICDGWIGGAADRGHTSQSEIRLFQA